MTTRAEEHFAGLADIYPNGQSYAMSSSTGRGTHRMNRLRRAVIYSAKVRTQTARPVGYGGVPAEYAGFVEGGGSTEIVTTLKKPFQFNPPSFMLGLQVAPTADEATELIGGNLPASAGYLGAAGSSVEMFFERSMEVQGGSGEYGRLGVAKDILDVLAVMRGDPKLLEASDDKTLAQFSHTMTDLVKNGSELFFAPVAIAYSPDLVLFGLVTGINLRFLQFNRDLIPTMGYMDLTLDVHNATSNAGAMTAFVGADAAATAAAGSGGGGGTGPVQTGRRPVTGWGGGGTQRVS